MKISTIKQNHQRYQFSKVISYKIKKILIEYLFIVIFELFIKEINFQINSEIIIKIKGKGYQSILNEEFICPDFIFINDRVDNILNNSDCRKIYISSEENSEINTVKLVWNSKLQHTISMFKELSNIIEVDLSNFDSSEVIIMDYMFMMLTMIQ